MTESNNKQPEDFLPLSTTEFQILVVLFGRELHGYGILQEIAALNDGKKPGNTTLYRSIKTLEDDGLIEGVEEPEEDSESKGMPRRYYQITALGGKVARAEGTRLEKLALTARTKGILEIKSDLGIFYRG